MGKEKFRDFGEGITEEMIEAGDPRVLDLIQHSEDFRRLLFYFTLGRGKICPSCEDYGICEYPCEKIAEFIHERAPDLIVEEKDETEGTL